MHRGAQELDPKGEQIRASPAYSLIIHSPDNETRNLTQNVI